MATKKSNNNIFKIAGLGAIGALLYFKVIKGGGMNKAKAIDLIMKQFPTSNKMSLASMEEGYLIARASAIEKGSFVFEAKEYNPQNRAQFTVKRYSTMDGRWIASMTEAQLIAKYKASGLIK